MGGHKLKAIRQFLKLNQKEFAEKLKIKQSYYSSIERDESPISGNVLKVLFGEMAVSSQWFYLNEGLPFEGTYTKEDMKIFLYGEHGKIEQEKLDAEIKRRTEVDLGIDPNKKKVTSKSVNERLNLIEDEVTKLKEKISEISAEDRIA